MMLTHCSKHIRMYLSSQLEAVHKLTTISTHMVVLLYDNFRLQVNEQEMRAMVSSPDDVNYIHVSSFANLKDGHLQKLIGDQICDGRTILLWY